MQKRLTVSQARAEVLKRTGNSEDGNNSPDLLDQLTAMIGSVQRLLAVQHGNLLPRKTVGIPLVSGRRWYPIPCDPSGLITVKVKPVGVSLGDVLNGILPEDVIDADPGTPERYEVRTTVGVVGVNISVPGTGYINGSTATFTAPSDTSAGAAAGLVVVSPTSPGPASSVTITDPGAEYLVAPTVTLPTGSGVTAVAALGTVDAIYLAPVPNDNGTLWVTYREVPPLIVADTDALAFDAEAVIATVTAEYGAATKHPLTEAFAEQKKAALSLVLARAPLRPAGAGFSMSPARS